MGTVRVVILGGGFGGIYAALEFERALRGRSNIEVTLVNEDNFFLFTPMLHEVAASDLSPTNIVNPIHKLLRRVRFFCGKVDKIDLERNEVHVSHGFEDHPHTLPYEHLLIGVGSVTNFYNLPGLRENAFTMKSLGDAIALRNHVIGLLEEADFECCAGIRNRLLTFIVAGGGFAGVETIAALNDFVREILPLYPNLSPDNVRMVLAASSEPVLPELDERLGRYAGSLLASQGVEVRFGTKVTAYEESVASLSTGEKLESCTVVWTAGTSPHPILNTLSCSKERGRLCATPFLQVEGLSNVWTAGDCAAVQDGTTGKFHPPTAQHALREGKVAARNILRAIDGQKPQPFTFRTLGQLASIGRRRGVAQVFGFRFSGLLAWFLWRSIYLSKLPRLEKRVRVALDWTLDLFFTKDIVKIPTREHLHTTASMPEALKPVAAAAAAHRTDGVAAVL